MLRRSRHERLSARTMASVERLSRKLMSGDTSGCVDRLLRLVPGLGGEVLLKVSLFGVGSEKERTRLVEYCRKLVDASPSTRRRTCH